MDLGPLPLDFLEHGRHLPVAWTLNKLVRALVLEKKAQGRTIPNLIWRSLAGFSDLLTVTL